MLAPSLVLLHDEDRFAPGLRSSIGGLWTAAEIALGSVFGALVITVVLHPHGR